jgi:multidrug efflux system membrane fusion protein
VIGSDDTVTMQPVTVDVAQITADQSLIDSGLEANEKIVVAGQYKLQQGSRIGVTAAVGVATKAASLFNASWIHIVS